MKNQALIDIANEITWDALLKDYSDIYRPVGPTEEMLVRRLADLAWRLHRTNLIEAEDSLSLDALMKLTTYQSAIQDSIERNTRSLKICQARRRAAEARPSAAIAKRPQRNKRPSLEDLPLSTTRIQ